MAGALLASAVPAIAQDNPRPPNESDVLQENPQTGATIVPDIRETPDPTDAPDPSNVVSVPSGPEVEPFTPPPAVPLGPGAMLPAPTQDPLAIDPNADPILSLVRRSEDLARFRQILATAIATNPATGEALARTAEARANRELAVSQRYPVADFTLSYFGTIARNFSDDPGNLLERSRPRSRTDALASIQQPLIDFGASANRVAAEQDRIVAANTTNC